MTNTCGLREGSLLFYKTFMMDSFAGGKVAQQSKRLQLRRLWKSREIMGCESIAATTDMLEDVFGCFVM